MTEFALGIVTRDADRHQARVPVFCKEHSQITIKLSREHRRERRCRASGVRRFQQYVISPA